MKQHLQQIRKRLYLLRNGASSTSMREKGVDYKLNFGVQVTKLKEVASDYYPDTELAELLWKENTRELKLLAILIQDPEKQESAEQWVYSLNNIELAEQLAMNLLSKIPNINQKASAWIRSEQTFVCITGFLVYMRLFMNGYSMEQEEYDQYFRTLFNALNSDSALLRNAAFNSLKHLGKQSILQAKNILAECRRNENLSEETKAGMIDSLEIEFDYYA